MPANIKQLALKNIRVAASVLVLVVVVAGVFISKELQDRSKAISSCGFRDDKTISVGAQKIQVEVASSDAARQKGLSGRTCITQNEGMLFTFSKAGQYSFWMQNMKFPIDMVWISPKHVVTVIQENVLPSTYPDSFVNPADHPAQYVLELQAHRTTSLGMNPGTPIYF